MRWTAWSAVLLVLLAAASLSVARTGLELIDGRVLEGVTVERVDGGYQLLLESGARIVVPEALVREVRLIVEPAETATPDEVLPEAPVQDPAEEIPPEELPLEPPLRKTYSQLAVFGPQRAVVARNNVDPSWWPSSDWRQDLVENEFEASSWMNSTVGARWVPEESFDPSDDWIISPPARWASPPVGSAWRPREGFPGFDAGPEFD